MKKSIFIGGIAMGLTGCGAAQDNSICTSVIYPPFPDDASESVALQDDLDWQWKRAEACLHRQGYRLAGSEDPAETVAKAVVEACEAEVGAAAALIHKRDFDQSLAPTVRGKMDEAQESERLARESYERFALLKVVEGRAGNCRP